MAAVRFNGGHYVADVRADVLNPAATAGTWVTIDGMDNSGEGELCGIPEYGRRTSAWQPVLVVYERVL